MELENLKTEKFLSAIQEENLLELEKIINSGIKIDLVDSDGWTGLMHACNKNTKTEIISLLIKKGANINHKGIHGYSPLLIICEYNQNPKILEILLKNKADINTKDNYGWTGLIHASQYNNKEIIEILIKNKIDLTIKNNNGWNALMFAKENMEESEIVNLIKVFSINDLRERVVFVIKNKFFELFENVIVDYKKVFCNYGLCNFLNLYVLYGGEDSKLLEKIGFDLREKDYYGWNFESYKGWRKRNGFVLYLMIFV